MNQFNDRLKIVISGESVNAFAKKCGITEGTLRTYLSGSSLPGLEKLVAISDAAQVNIEWLATGKGPMLIGDRGKRDIKLFKIFFEVYAEYEKVLGAPLSLEEKAWSMSRIFNFYWERNYLEYEEAKNLISHEIEMLHELIQLSNRVINSGLTRERANEVIRDFSKQLWYKEESEVIANELIKSGIFK